MASEGEGYSGKDRNTSILTTDIYNEPRISPRTISRQQINHQRKREDELVGWRVPGLVTMFHSFSCKLILGGLFLQLRLTLVD
jgi:hypothetical protein